MTEVQSKLIELLCEIDSLCQKNHIQYFLSGESALSAYRSKHFESETPELNIYMTLSDALKLQNLILKEGREDRNLDSLYTNDFYPNLVFKYCNTNTLYIDLRNNSGLNALGISVKILVLKIQYKGINGIIARLLENGWVYNYNDYSKDRLTRKRLLIQKFTLFFINLSRKKYKKIMLNFIEKTQQNANFNDSFYNISLYGKKTTFPKKMFCKTRMVTLEGKDFPIPYEYSSYFEVFYKLRWNNKEFKRKEITESTIIDPNLPFKYYLDYIQKESISLDYQDEKMKAKEIDRRFNMGNQIINKAWNFVLRSSARYKLWEFYIPQKENILQLYQKNDWKELQNVFTTYDEIIQKFYYKGLGVCFDKEIFQIYVEMLKKTGENELAENLVTLIPEAHFQSIKIK